MDSRRQRLCRPGLLMFKIQSIILFLALFVQPLHAQVQKNQVTGQKISRPAEDPRWGQDSVYNDEQKSAPVRHLPYQQRWHHFIQILNDNDSYTLTANDGYYTNGLKLVYGWNSSKDSANTTIHTLEIGQLMYNAKNGSYRRKEELDRPVTAFLYARYGAQHFTANNSLMAWGINVGTIGPPALGRPMQQAIHSLFNMYTPEEWDYQLNTEIGVNADFTWSPSVSLSSSDAPVFRLLPVVAASLGNTFTGASLGSVFSLGKMGINSQTIFWQSHINGYNNESFVYFYPEMLMSFYNATIQGGLFRSDKGPYTGKLNHLRYRQTLGWMHSGPVFNIGLGFIFDSRESKTQWHSQWYGRIQLGLNF